MIHLPFVTMVSKSIPWDFDTGDNLLLTRPLAGKWVTFS